MLCCLQSCTCVVLSTVLHMWFVLIALKFGNDSLKYIFTWLVRFHVFLIYYFTLSLMTPNNPTQAITFSPWAFLHSITVWGFEGAWYRYIYLFRDHFSSNHIICLSETFLLQKLTKSGKLTKILIPCWLDSDSASIVACTPSIKTFKLPRSQVLLYHRTCKRDFLCSWPSLNSYLKLREICEWVLYPWYCHCIKNFPLF